MVKTKKLSLADILDPTVRALIETAEIEAKGTCSPPPLDLKAIRARADELDPESPIKADIYSLLIEVERLSGVR